MNNLLSYYWLVDAKIIASGNYLPVLIPRLELFALKLKLKQLIADADNTQYIGTMMKPLIS